MPSFYLAMIVIFRIVMRRAQTESVHRNMTFFCMMDSLNKVSFGVVFAILYYQVPGKVFCISPHPETFHPNHPPTHLYIAYNATTVSRHICLISNLKSSEPTLQPYSKSSHLHCTVCDYNVKIPLDSKIETLGAKNGNLKLHM